MISKAIKSSYWKTKEPKTKMGKVLNSIFEYVKKYTYYIITDRYHRYKERISRSLAYARFGWLNYDFDSKSLYRLMEFKMKRIYSVLKNGHLIQDKKDLDALKEAIVICKRLGNEMHEDKYLREHDKKWGNMQYKFIPIPGKDGTKSTHSRWHTWRKQAKTKKQQRQETKEFLACWTKGEEDRKADLDRLNEIFKIHEPAWWD